MTECRRVRAADVGPGHPAYGSENARYLFQIDTPERQRVFLVHAPNRWAVVTLEIIFLLADEFSPRCQLLASLYGESSDEFAPVRMPEMEYLDFIRDVVCSDLLTSSSLALHALGEAVQLIHE